ncbi:MAG TPA: cation-transporting P-type ATPase [Actinomycetes bacterium]|nr:cation-transporting P-type ATPase [Actinomycetes bacterium]
MASVPARPDAGVPGRGLTQSEAAVRLRRDGPNVLPRARPRSTARALAAQLTHFFALMLWVAAGLAVLAGLPQLGVAIVIVVLLNGVFAFAQEWRADQAGRRLQEMLPARVVVRRDARRAVVAAAELVVGDLVLLSAGDRISADLRLMVSDGLAVDESMLTGESVPVPRDVDHRVFAGTFVVEGEAEAVVEATGSRTRLAEIAALTREGHRPVSPLARRLHRVVWVVAVLAVATGAGFFGLALALGSPAQDGFLFAVGVTVALVPEGLLPTVTLSLARAAQRMAAQHALVRHLEAVETLGATTFVCTDKTGTLTRNEMSVVEAWTRHGSVRVEGGGYTPVGRLAGSPTAVEAIRAAALVAARCSTGRVVRRGEQWQPQGDPMEVALHVLALRAGADVEADERARPARRRFPFDPRRRRMSLVTTDAVLLKGAPEAVLPRCLDVPPSAAAAVAGLGHRGLRVLAVAARRLADEALPADVETAECDLELLALIGIEDPPREGVAEALADLRQAAIRVAMVTGDAPETARAIARETGLLGPDELVVTGADLPEDDQMLGELLDRDGVVVARVAPQDKQRIARALQGRGHVVAMTGDGVNDGPALRAADIGVAMGGSGTDVAREAADLVLLDDHLATIVVAVAAGRATFTNIRRFLTYHLTDNVAELTPFVVWALSGGQVPLALGVLQVLALDIGTDLLPALALGGEPPSPRVLQGPARSGALIDARLLRRVFGVLGPAEAVVEMAAFVAVLLAGGWVWAATPSESLLAGASGAAFAAVVLGQLANAFACRSETSWVGQKGLRGNPLLLVAVGIELVLLVGFLTVDPVASLLGGAWPPALGWALAATAIPVLLAADTLAKAVRSSAARRRRTASGA